MQSFCQFYAETCNLTDYLENCSVSFSVARRLCRLCLLPCISCISCPKDVRKFCPFIYFLPTWHPFNDNLLEIVSCFLCCLLFTLYAACVASLLFGFFFSGTFDAYLRVNCISFSNVLPLSLSCSLAPSMAIMLSVFSQQFPVKMLKSWKVHCSQMQATHSWQRDSQADRRTDRLTDWERDSQSADWLTDQKEQHLWRKTWPRHGRPGHATLLRQDVPNGKPLNWRRHMDETRADTARRCARCRRHNDNPVELSRTCRVWGMHFKRGYFIHSYTGIKPNNGINIIKCG